MMINLLKSHSQYLLLLTVPVITYKSSFISKTDMHLKGLMSLTHFDFEQSCDYWWQVFLLSCLSSLWALSLNHSHDPLTIKTKESTILTVMMSTSVYAYFISKFFKELHSNINQFSSFPVIQHDQIILQLPSIWNFYFYKNCYILLHMTSVGILGKLQGEVTFGGNFIPTFKVLQVFLNIIYKWNMKWPMKKEQISNFHSTNYSIFNNHPIVNIIQYWYWQCC